VSRLDFAPKIDEIKVTDIKRGLGAFTPKPGKAISFASLKAALKKAGYTLDSAEVTVTGALLRDDAGWWIESDGSKQRFAIEAAGADDLLAGMAPGARFEVTGGWQTEGAGAAAREVIRPRAAQRLTRAPAGHGGAAGSPPGEIHVGEIHASLAGAGREPRARAAPIRTTSPGLTVYKGGAVTARYHFTARHLGALRADHHSLRLSASYTPTPTVQLEAEVPYMWTSFDDGARAGSGHGLGNVVLWGKHRFYRSVETWGDRQAALRFGVELPTAKDHDFNEARVDAAEFVRRQLSASDGGLALRADAAYSQAKGRVLLGANVEGALRTERDGFRKGHELRVNTDLEYVLLPIKYRSPTRELFVILETTFLHNGRGRALGRSAPGSGSTEFYVAPALQYVVSARLVAEASLQVPVVRDAGPLVLRTDRSFLFGIRYLY
jgi:hypothetical protein